MDDMEQILYGTMQDFLLDIAILLPGKLEVLSHTFRNHLHIMNVRQEKLLELVTLSLSYVVKAKDSPTPENVERVYVTLQQVQKAMASVRGEVDYWRTSVASLGDVATEATVITPLAERFRYILELNETIEGELLEDSNG